MRRLFVIIIASIGLSAGVATAQEQQPGASIEQPPPPSTKERLESSERTARNTLYFEFGGNGIIYTLNYERFLADSMSLRAGFGLFPVKAAPGAKSKHATLIWMPLTFNYFLLGNADHKVELGIGVLPVYATAAVDTLGAKPKGPGFSLAGTASIGYRYAPHDGGFSWKAAFTPFFGTFGFSPWFGIGIGATL